MIISASLLRGSLKCSQSMKTNKGFTLLEMVVVIVILGVLAASITTFISFGTQIYTDVTKRDEIVSSARFAIERLNREIRFAVPNSIRVNGNATRQCIEFTPIILSTIYTDIPVSPEPSSANIKVIAFDENLFNSGFTSNLKVGAYILNANEFYSNSNKKTFLLANNTIVKGVGVNENEWTLTLDSPETFAQDSPTNRLFFFNDAVSYCVLNTRLTRHQAYTRNSDNTPQTQGVLMAEDINMFDNNGNLLPPFWSSEATQLRNSLATVKFIFDYNNEIVIFNNEIQVQNVP